MYVCIYIYILNIVQYVYIYIYILKGKAGYATSLEEHSCARAGARLAQELKCRDFEEGKSTDDYPKSCPNP